MQIVSALACEFVETITASLTMSNLVPSSSTFLNLMQIDIILHRCCIAMILKLTPPENRPTSIPAIISGFWLHVIDLRLADLTRYNNKPYQYYYEDVASAPKCPLPDEGRVGQDLRKQRMTKHIKCYRLSPAPYT